MSLRLVDTRTRDRTALAVVAGVLGIVLLTSGAGTYARWSDTEGVGGGSITAGSVSIEADAPPTLELLSQQPNGSRTFASTANCSVPTGFVQCRVVTATLAQERLIVGDTIRIRQSATLDAEGDNLTGVVSFEVTTRSTDLISAATLTAGITPPAGSTSSGSGSRIETPIDLSAGQGPGTYSAFVDIAVPPANGGNRWGTDLRNQSLDLDSASWSFIQTR